MPAPWEAGTTAPLERPGRGRAEGQRRVFGRRPTVLGHRGLGHGTVGSAVENTIGSVLAAVAAGLRWVELDVRRTEDDHLVVGHYPMIDESNVVALLSLEQARRLGAVTLEELLAAVPAGIGVNLDLKTSLEDALRPPERTTAALLAPVAEEVARERPVLVSSFDPAAVVGFGERAPSVPRGLLTWFTFPLRKAIPAAAHLGADVVAAHWSSFAANDHDRAAGVFELDYTVQVAHDAGLEVMAWCPQPEPALDLLHAGVDAVVVDDVPQALSRLRGVAD